MIAPPFTPKHIENACAPLGSVITHLGIKVRLKVAGPWDTRRLTFMFPDGRSLLLEVEANTENTVTHLICLGWLSKNGDVS